jgi:nicotinamidase-related amidase
MPPTALIVVDLQLGTEDPSWGPRNNPDCVANVEALLEAWRARREPVVYIRHDSVEPGSTLRPGEPGNDLHPVLAAEPDLFVTKRVSSAFHGEPDLAAWLRARGIERLVMCGVQTNMCCETSARVGAVLGFDVGFVIDATYTHDRLTRDGDLISADMLAQVTAVNFEPEFGRVISTPEAIDELELRRVA